ncbi:hypothetical protein PMIN07_001423 [Paraphaeosphaeria minitans]
MGKVKKNYEGKLDFDATGIDLEWDTHGKSDHTHVKNDLLGKYTQLYGARCEYLFKLWKCFANGKYS